MPRTTAPTTITGTISVACGCVAVVIDSGTRLAGPNPLVTARVSQPCASGHPEKVGAGVIIHRVPSAVTVLEPAA